MAPQQQMQPHEQGEAIGMPLPARRRHLVIKLGDPGNPQAPPRPHTMLTERQSDFVTDGREDCSTSHDGHGGHSVESDDTAGAAQVPRSHQVVLVQIPRMRRTWGRVGLSEPGRLARGALRIAVSTQYTLDRRETGRWNHAVAMQCVSNNLGSHAREAPRPMGTLLPTLPPAEDFLLHPFRETSRAGVRSATAIPQPIPAELAKSTEPLGQPLAAAPEASNDLGKRNTLFVPGDRLLTSSILVAGSHASLPTVSVGKVRTRCVYLPAKPSSVSDVVKAH